MHHLYSAPNFEKVEGAYWFGLIVRPFFRLFVRSYVTLHLLKNRGCWGFNISKIGRPYTILGIISHLSALYWKSNALFLKNN